MRLTESQHKFQEDRVRVWGQITKESRKTEALTERERRFLVNAGLSTCLLHPRKGLVLPPPPPARPRPSPNVEGDRTATSQEKAKRTFAEPRCNAVYSNRAGDGALHHLPEPRWDPGARSRGAAPHQLSILRLVVYTCCSLSFSRVSGSQLPVSFRSPPGSLVRV